MVLPVWLYLRIFALIDQKLRYKNAEGAVLYEKFYQCAMRHLRRSGALDNSDHFTYHHEEALESLPRLNDDEKIAIKLLLVQELSEIAQKILLSNDEIDNTNWQFEEFTIKRLLQNVFSVH